MRRRLVSNPNPRTHAIQKRTRFLVQRHQQVLHRLCHVVILSALDAFGVREVPDAFVEFHNLRVCRGLGREGSRHDCMQQLRELPCPGVDCHDFSFESRWWTERNQIRTACRPACPVGGPYLFRFGDVAFDVGEAHARWPSEAEALLEDGSVGNRTAA